MRRLAEPQFDRRQRTTGRFPDTAGDMGEGRIDRLKARPRRAGANRAPLAWFLRLRAAEQL